MSIACAHRATLQFVTRTHTIKHFSQLVKTSFLQVQLEADALACALLVSVHIVENKSPHFAVIAYQNKSALSVVTFNEV